MTREEIGLFNTTLMMLAGCLSAIRLYCSESDRRKIDGAHGILRAVAARHGGTVPDLDMYAPGLDLLTCRDLGMHFARVSREHGVGGGEDEDAAALRDFQCAVSGVLSCHGYKDEARPLWEMYLHGLTPAEAEDRWSNALSAAEQVELVTEAGNGLGLNDRRRGGLYPSDLGYLLRGAPYRKAVQSLKNDYFPGLIAEVHRRLAGETGPPGRASDFPDAAELPAT